MENSITRQYIKPSNSCKIYVTVHTLFMHLLPEQGQRMRLAGHPALCQRRTSNGLDAVTVRICPALWTGVNYNKYTL